MLWERRRMRPVIDEQITLASLLVDVAASRYASGGGAQADILRAEAEVARLQAKRQSLDAQNRSAEAMLNAGLGLRTDERRVGKECVRTCRSRWSQYP